MNTDVETLSPTLVKLTVEVSFDDLRPSLDAAYKKIGQQLRVKGFRPGKVPPAIIDRQVGRAMVLEEAVNEALPRFYGDAVREKDLLALGQPEVEVTQFADGAELVFTAQVEVRPPLELPAYDQLSVQVDSTEPSAEEVAEQLDGMRDRFATLSSVERPAQDGDYVTIDTSATVDATALEELAGTGQSYRVGSEGLIPGLDAALREHSAGETVTFQAELADGRQAAVEVIIRSVREKVLPELDDEFASTASEFDTLEELRADLRQRMGRVKRLSQGLQARDRLLEALLAQVEVPMPEKLLEEEYGARRRAMLAQLEQASLGLEAYLATEELTEAEFESQLKDSAQKAIRSQLVLDEIVRREQLSVTEAELSDQVVRRAAQYGVSADLYARELVNQGQLPALMGELLRAKALAFVLEQATITDPDGERVDLDEITAAID